MAGRNAKSEVEIARPVFIHGCWRTGSTYVWSKFREQRRFRCYLEPLHEALLDKPESHFENEHAQQVTRKLRHPSLAEHYFAEYPFRPEGGVERFAKHLPYQRYCLEPGDEDAALHGYVSNLLEYARTRGQIPVLQFNRGLLRSRWLHHHFNSVDILLLRDPLEVWLSYASFAERYFMTVTACIAGQNSQSRWFSPLQELVRVPQFVSRNFQEDFNFYYQFTGESAARLFLIFYYFAVVTALYNASFCEAILDLDAITQEQRARAKAEGALAGCGLAISMADCRLPMHPERKAAERQYKAEMRDVVALVRERLGGRLALARARYAQIRDFISEPYRELFTEFLHADDALPARASS